MEIEIYGTLRWLLEETMVGDYRIGMTVPCFFILWCSYLVNELGLCCCEGKKEQKEKKRKTGTKRSKSKHRVVEFVSIPPLAFNPVCSLNFPRLVSKFSCFTYSLIHTQSFVHSTIHLLIFSATHPLILSPPRYPCTCSFFHSQSWAASRTPCWVG